MIECAVFGRLQAIATPLVQNMEKVQIIPPPKDVDKRVLTWKGASVLGRMEGVTDMWVTGADWVSNGIIVHFAPPHTSPEYVRNAGSKRTMLLIVSVANVVKKPFVATIMLIQL